MSVPNEQQGPVEVCPDINLFTQILFPEQCQGPDEFILDLEQLGYLARLGSQGLDSLNGEVSRLNEELAIVDHQTRDMASQNYQIFVQSAQTTNKIKTSLDEGSRAVQKLTTETLPSLKKEIASFAHEPCNNLQSEKRGIEALFRKEVNVSKVLEMQWIVRRCLAEEKLPEAIKVLQAAQDMMKNVEDPPLILSKTCNEVTQLKTEIQHALLSKLSSGSIGLSECLQTVSLLRSFFPDDKALRFRFLQSRMKDITFEQARTWIFDTLTQHRAAFGGDSNHYLSTWVSIQMNRVLSDMEKHIDHGEGVDSLMTQSTYFGESLARVGADVRGLIIPMFGDHVVKKIQHDLTQCEIQFSRNLHQFNLSTSVSSSLARPDSSNLDLPGPDDLTPPKQLILHTPLALYLNEVLTILNFVGKCPLTQCVPLVVAKLNASVQKIGCELENWGASEGLTWEAREQIEFNRLKRYFEHLLLPHLDKVVRVIFPPASLAEVTGLGITECANMIQVKYTKPVE